MDDQLYKIGTVSKLTGISVERLRAWERRYGMHPTERAGRTRFYDGEQLDRLKKIKALLDRGQTIGQLARLGPAEIDRRLGVAPRPSQSGLRVGLVGADLVLAERDAGGARLDIHGRWASPESFDAHLDILPELDVVAVLLPTLDPERIERYLDAVRDAALVFAYRYATEADLQTAGAFGVTLMPWPASWSAVEEACLAQPRAPLSDTGPPRRFTDDELLHIAMAASRTGCECTRGMVDLLGALNAFTAHAERCAAGDSEHPSTAASAHAARAELEEALHVFVQRHALIHTHD